MGRLRAAAALAALAAGAPAAGAAQELFATPAEDEAARPVALVADEVTYDRTTGVVTARGSVEVYYGQRTLTADRIAYDSRADRIRAEGDLVLRDEGGDTGYADFAELDPQLQDGVVRGARAVIADGAGRLSAVEARRFGGRYNALAKAVYSSCEVCVGHPTPTWRIRARRIVHDEEAREIYYEDAWFDLFGQPVAYLPYFSHPDPTVKRLSGFLAPSFRRSSVYGYGIKTPYFWAIDPTRDVTVTPFLTSQDGPIVEGEYRQFFDNGLMEIEGSLARTSLEEDQAAFEGHVFGFGRYRLDTGVGLGFDVRATTDDGYLERFDFSDDDRLTSEVFAQRFRERDFFNVSGVYFQSLRADEPDEQIPFAVPEFEVRRGFDEGLFGGELGFEASGVNLLRRDGRDVARFTVGADWERGHVFDNGLVGRAFADARVDFYRIADDPDIEEGLTIRGAPLAGGELRYPLIAFTGDVSHIVEPIGQIVLAPEGLNPDDIPNEDSQIVEFDETNLFEINRFPGFDRVESGPRANLGMRYELASADDLRFGAAVGRVFRTEGDTAFSEGSGLDGEQSDYVGAWSLDVGRWFAIANRVRVSDDFNLNRNEVFGRARYAGASLAGSYVFLEDDAIAGTLGDRSEVALNASLDVTRNWSVGGFVRRDLVDGQYIDAIASVSYEDECVGVDLFVDRDFTDSENAPAGTSVGLQVRLFGVAGDERPSSGVCEPRVARRE